MSDADSQIVSTLISIPPADRRWIARSRLARRLDAGAGHRLVHVRAPAGFGKTSLVAAWAQRRREAGVPVAWVSLSRSHDDARTLLRYIVASLRRAWSGVGEATLTLLNANMPVAVTSLVTTFVNELGGLGEPTWLVLDDFHCVTAAEANAAFESLLNLAPPKLHFVLTSREAAAFPLGRLRQAGSLFELGPRDLEFSREEVAAFLEQEALALTPAQSAALARNTGGWAAGLRLAAIAIRDEREPGRFIESFAGGHAAIAEFLQQDVLQRQPPGLQRFLLDSGLLGELSPPLCDFVLAREDSRAMLATAYDKGLFLFTADAGGERFRYHHMFADFLRNRLEREDPERARQLYARASRWHAEHGAWREAVDFAFRAGDVATAGALLEAHSEAIFASGQLEQLEALAARLPEAVLDTCPRLLLDLVWIHTLRWEIEKGKRLMRRVERYLERLAASQEVPQALREKVLHREIMFRMLQDQLDEGDALWEQWPLVATGENAYFEGSAESPHLVASRERFQCRFVIAKAPRVRRKYTDAGAEYGTVWFDCLIAPAYLMAGEAERAEAVLRGAIAVARRTSGEASPLVAMPSMLLAEVLYERNDLDAVRTIIATWLPKADQIGFVDQLIAGYVCAARMAAMDGESAQALEILGRGEQLAAEHAFERLQMHLTAERVRQLLRLGRAGQARELLPARQRPALSPPGRTATVADEMLAIAAARLALGTAEAGAAVKTTKAWVNHCEGHGCLRDAIRLRAVLAVLLQAAGEAREAWRALRPALRHAASTGIMRPLIDEGARLQRIIEAVPLEAADLEPDIRRVTAALRELLAEGGTDGGRLPATAPGAVDALTPREREVLLQVADGSSNKEIAARLGLSEATVKWHLAHVFDKLDVHRRVGAVRRARELGILE